MLSTLSSISEPGFKGNTIGTGATIRDILHTDAHRPEIAEMRKFYPYICTYFRLWRERQINTPLALFIWGYCGTGKTEFSHIFRALFGDIETIASGMIRALARDSTDNESLFRSTFKLHEHGDPRELFQKQCEFVAHYGIARLLNFQWTEKCPLMLDGNHFLPQLIPNSTDALVVPVFFQCSDETQHVKMMQWPSHARVMKKEEIKTARDLQDFIVQSAREKGLPIFEYDDQAGALSHVNERMRVFLEQS